MSNQVVQIYHVTLKGELTQWCWVFHRTLKVTQLLTKRITVLATAR
jgi:hypothetical protein